jgi:hypothetical protein
MNSKLSAALLATSIFVAGMAALPSAAAAQADPIQIEKVLTSGGFYQDAYHNMNLLPALLGITFENQSSADATDVVFVVEGYGFANRINDVGRFAKGVRIHHNFPVDAFGIGGSVRVHVVQVSFADGTVWQNPDAL